MAVIMDKNHLTSGEGRHIIVGVDGKRIMLRRLSPLFGLLLLGFLASACRPERVLAPGDLLHLTSFTENSVHVDVTLVRDNDGSLFLTATFTPPPDYHLYGKDIPRDGVDGLGRPTLLELTADSKMLALASITESVSPVDEMFEIVSLPVYPSGPVTLSLAVALPPGNGWVDDEISLTFMACSATECKPPVVGKFVSVHVPGADAISNP